MIAHHFIKNCEEEEEEKKNRFDKLAQRLREDSQRRSLLPIKQRKESEDKSRRKYLFEFLEKNFYYKV